MSDDVKRESPLDAAESQTLSMRGNSLRENRETPETSPPPLGEERSEKAPGRTADMHVPGESDGFVVPAKRANKAGPWAAAESVEGREPTKGNADRTLPAPDTEPGKHGIGLEGIRQAARQDRKVRFTALLHHVTPQLLTESYFALKPAAAPGVDGVTWRQYGEGLEDRLADLHARIHRGAYRAQPSKRAWIPKADGRQRPLGLAALEDKIVQQAVRTVLEHIYEEDFVGYSYGFRPGRGSHNALDALWVGITKRKVNWVLDADIRGYFDAINHEWMLRFLEHRVADRRILRLIRKWLTAGVSDAGQWSKTTVVTPQGAVISPLLANVFLHYVFDLWAQQWRKTSAEGDVIVVRYADDFVVGFQHRGEAERFLRDLRSRFAKFGLELHPDKTRLIEFGRFAAENRQQRGEGKPETFDFLGFTHYCGTTRKGTFTVGRKSIAKRMRATLQAIKRELRRRMHARLCALGGWLRDVVRGWFQYHAVPGNVESLDTFRTQVSRLWLAALRRRSQKGACWTWERMNRVIARWLPPARILHPYPDRRLIVTRPKVGAV
jgi:group II intron reverse transcriptase/maturase